MKHVVAIINAHGGFEALKKKAIRVNPPTPSFMRLCIEYVGKGPRGQALLSIAHYYEQAGDLMSDPEVVVEVPNGEGWDVGKSWGPVAITMHGTNYHREAVVVRDGKVFVDARQVKDIKSFLALWNRNIGEQGYLDTFKAQQGA